MLPVLRQADQFLEWMMGQGFVLLAIFVMNAAALIFALGQVRQAREAAKKARTAATVSKQSAEQAWGALSKQLYQVALADAVSHVTQIENAVSQGDWQLARVRAGDLRDSLARVSSSLPARLRNLLLGDQGHMSIVYGHVAEKCRDPEYIVTEDLEMGLNVMSTELNSLLGKTTYRQGGV